VCTFRDASIRLVFFKESTISVFPLSFKVPRVLMNSLVFGCSSLQSLTIIKFPSRRRSEIAAHIARFLIFLGKLYDQSRGCGPWTFPPPDRKSVAYGTGVGRGGV